jgi:hypothetical protein
MIRDRILKLHKALLYVPPFLITLGLIITFVLYSIRTGMEQIPGGIPYKQQLGWELISIIVLTLLAFVPSYVVAEVLTFILFRFKNRIEIREQE